MPEDRPIWPLTMGHLEVSHDILVGIFKDDPEPMPPWQAGDREKLEMLCNCTEVEAFGVQKYPDLVSKTAKLFYSGVKLHAFPNGNKRFALITTISFLIINTHRLVAEEGVPARFATEIAKSDPHEPDGTPEKMIEEATDFFRDKIEPYDWDATLSASEGD